MLKAEAKAVKAAAKVKKVKPEVVEQEQPSTASIFKAKCLERYGFYSAGLLLAPDKDGDIKIMSNLTNYKIIINHMYPEIKYSEFERRPYLGSRPLTSEDILIITDRLTVFLKGYNVKLKEVEQAIDRLLAEIKFNPLSDYFTGLTPAKTNHLDNWLTTVCSVKDTEINRILGRKWLISCVARAMKPGCYVEGALILYGTQAAGKTWFFKNLNPKADYYCGSNVDISNIQKACQTYQGKFVIEFGELSSISKVNLEDTKQYLTETHDTYVPKYENLPVTIARQMVFGGSTNNPGILSDTTGNRRFWCVEVDDQINQAFFLSIKEELWSEAYQAYCRGEVWTLTIEERNMLEITNGQFEADDPLRDYLAQELDTYGDNSMSAAKLKEIVNRFDRKVHPQTISKAMIKLGWQRKKMTSGPSKDCICYVRPV
jgi:putative DNA primase/helicase